MAIFEQTGLRLYERVLGYLQTAFPGRAIRRHLTAKQLAEFCTFLEYVELREHAGGERWSDDGSREKLALKFYLAKAIAESTPPAEKMPELYRAFARELDVDDIVLTFNWDCLVENALDAEARAYTYEFAGDRIWLVKAHGSVHWRLGTPNPESLLQRSTMDWQPIDWGTEMVRNDVHLSDALRAPEAWLGRGPLGDVRPLIVLPGFGKAYDVRDLSPLWYKIEAAFGYTEDVYIIGLGLPADDFFIRSFFLHNLPFDGEYAKQRQLTIINPGSEVLRAFNFLLGGPNVQWIREPFMAKHIELMKRLRLQRDIESSP